MQKSFSVAICLFGLGVAPQAEAGSDQFSTNTIEIPSHLTTVANMVPDNIGEMPRVVPTDIVNHTINNIDNQAAMASRRLDTDRIMPRNTKLQNEAAIEMPVEGRNAAIQNNEQHTPRQAATNHASRERAMSEAEKAQMKNYAPFMRNLMMSANFAPAGEKSIKAAKVVRGGKQVIVLGGSN